MALYIITNKTIKMANNGKGIGPHGLGAPKSVAKYGSMAKQAKKPTEPKTGDKKKKSDEKLEISVRGRQAESDRVVERAAAEKVKQKIKDVLPESGEHARQRSLARGSQMGTFFGLEKLFKK